MSQLSPTEFHTYSVKRKVCDDLICKWQTSFATSLKKGHYFLNFEDKDQCIIKLTYAKGNLWLPIIGFMNSLCIYFTCMTTGHASIGEYCHLVEKLLSKLANISSWNTTSMTHPLDHAT